MTEMNSQPSLRRLAFISNQTFIGTPSSFAMCRTIRCSVLPLTPYSGAIFLHFSPEYTRRKISSYKLGETLER
ncbi:MAG TPA: hypothetical protein VIT46_05910 [Gaiellaceae bacterium]